MRLLMRTIRALLLAASLLLLAACGDSTADVDSGQPGDGDEPTEDVRQDDTSQQVDDEEVDDPAMDDQDIDDPDMDDQDSPAPGNGTDGDYVRTESQLEIVSPRTAAIDELVVTGDGTTVLVRYQSGSEPCALARVVATETDTRVEVLLETGLNPNAAAMTCIAGVFGYEIETQLTAPVGARELIAVAAEAVPPVSEDPFEGAEFPTDQYLGLTQPEAEALGEIEQRAVRIARIDDEIFGLTQDFVPTRVNIEIEDGVIVAATSG